MELRRVAAKVQTFFHTNLLVSAFAVGENAFWHKTYQGFPTLRWCHCTSRPANNISPHGVNHPVSPLRKVINYSHAQGLPVVPCTIGRKTRRIDLQSARPFRPGPSFATRRVGSDLGNIFISERSLFPGEDGLCA